MNIKHEISITVINNVLNVDHSNLDGKLLCVLILEHANWLDTLATGKYRIMVFDKLYKLIARINKYNATDDVLSARWTLFNF